MGRRIEFHALGRFAPSRPQNMRPCTSRSPGSTFSCCVRFGTKISKRLPYSVLITSTVLMKIKLRAWCPAGPTIRIFNGTEILQQFSKHLRLFSLSNNCFWPTCHCHFLLLRRVKDRVTQFLPHYNVAQCLKTQEVGRYCKVMYICMCN
jgi:hypothetical protein